MSKDDFIKMTKPTLRNKVKECVSAVEKWKDNPCYKNIVIYRIITINDLYEALHEKVPVEYSYETWNITDEIINDFRTNPTKYYRQVSLQKNQKVEKKEPSKQENKIQSQQTDQKYTLSLAWTESPSEDISSTIDTIKEYFDDLDMNALEEENYSSGDGIEHKIKYEFEGDERTFKILKYSAQFILDTISNTDYEKFNIAIFGKKQSDDSKIEKEYSLEDEVKFMKKEINTLKKALNSLLPIDQRV
jgi:hypothetical protein